MAAAVTDAVYNYLRDQNRPFSANDIVDNLNKEHGKAQVQKSLDHLVGQGKVMEKTYGKQKVYCVVQSDADTVNDMDLKQWDREIEELAGKLQNAEEQLKKDEAELKLLSAAPTTDQAQRDKEDLESEIAALKAKLDSLTKNTTPISPEMRDKIVGDHEKMCREYRKRKRICMEMIGSIMEGYPKTKKHLIEEMGIETDEDCGFVL